VEGDIKKALASKLGAGRLNLISSSQSIAVTNARMPTQNVGFRNIPRAVERYTQAATTKPTAQRITTQAEVLPSQVLSGQVEIEAQLAVSISPGVNHGGGNIAPQHSAPQSTNTSQHRQLDAAAPEFHPAEGVVGGSEQGEELPRNATDPSGRAT
jgi:hypothetical protein